jgi:hypothetical protein
MVRPSKTALIASVVMLTSISQCVAKQSGLPKPGPEHEALTKMEGTWDAALTVLGIKSTAEMTYKTECGGLWAMQDLKGDFGGAQLHTKHLHGYDPVKKKYISVQVDSMSTVPMILEGTYDESKTVLTQTGEARDFNGKPEQVQSVTKHVDDDHVTVEVYRIYPNGKERKMISIDYTRRKKPT